ncbi:MAG TPA: PQQ-dependent dehydrogenase, methanol/ethanol family, partial [Burkholderiaceae bacterium]|nr:PQQ-dependent dehydrogenase, methanol/ethanol family [Burkholderiaceae bacterium]
MKIRSHLLGATLALLFCGAHAQNDQALKNDAKSTGDVLTYGMGYNNQRYSPLTQINTKNVSKLVPVWAYSLNNTQSHESQPIVHDGVMYVTTHDATMAINPLT